MWFERSGEGLRVSKAMGSQAGGEVEQDSAEAGAQATLATTAAGWLHLDGSKTTPLLLRCRCWLPSMCC
ncbi:unnamed protein product [Urochloa humidicola]